MWFYIEKCETMDKLIRFINKYGHTSSCWPFETYRIEPATDWISSYLVLSRDDNWEWDWKDWHLPIPRLISKEYGFIKWLVENDKIDFEPIMKKEIWYWRSVEWVRGYETYNLENALLMLLSISNSPIEDLISYLK